MRRMGIISLVIVLALALALPAIWFGLHRGEDRAEGVGALQVATPLASPQASPAASPVASPVKGTPAPATPVPTPPPTPLQALLPTTGEVPSGLAPVQDDQRSADQVANQLAMPSGNATETAQQLRAWGWQGAYERQFRVAQGQQPAAGGITWLWTVVYRFANPTAATAAYDALTASAQAVGGLSATPVASLGNEARGLTEGGNDAVFNLWVRSKNDVIWIGGTAKKGYPRAQVEAVAQTILAKEAGVSLRATPIASPAAGPVIKIGMTVTTTDGSNMRSGPTTTENNVVEVVLPGTPLTVTGPSVVGDGHTWWPVTDPATGAKGYIASELIVPLPAS